MLLRIALAIAILAGVAVAVINFVKVKEKVTTVMTERDTLKTDLAKTSAELSSTKSTLTKTKSDLDTASKNLTTAKSDATRFQKEAVDQTKAATDLKTQLDKSTAERVDAQQKLAAWNTLGITVDQVKIVISDLRQSKTDLDTMTNQVASLGNQISMKDNQLRKLLNENYQVAEPNVTAKIIAVDPKYDFVILDVGQDKGMLPDGDMIVSRDAKPVATVRIRTVDSRTCVANVLPLPGGMRYDIFEGDIAFPVLPKP
jgi:hypothetical protein